MLVWKQHFLCALGELCVMDLSLLCDVGERTMAPSPYHCLSHFLQNGMTVVEVLTFSWTHILSAELFSATFTTRPCLPTPPPPAPELDLITTDNFRILYSCVLKKKKKERKHSA